MARAWHQVGRFNLGREDSRAAKEANEHALALRRKLLPKDHPDLGRSLNNLGLAEKTAGEPRRARDLLEEAVRIWRTSLPPGDPLIATGQSNLGAVQVDLGDYAAARRSHEQAVAIYRKALPPGHPNLGSGLNNLGVALQHLDDQAAAKACYLEALAIRRATLPEGHPQIGETLSNLGIAQGQTNEREAARKSLEEALAIFRKAPKVDRLDVAQLLVNLGGVCDELEDHAAAKAHYKEALAIRSESLPPDHPGIGDALYRLGRAQDDLGDHGAAKASLVRALAIYRRTYPKDHPSITACLSGLGAAHLELREYAAARSCFVEALGSLRRALPPSHAEIADCLNNLALVHDEMRDYAAARAGHEEALAIFRKALPPDLPRIASSLNNLGLSQSHLRDYVAARASFEEGLAIRRKAFPPGHPKIADTLYNLGHVQTDLKELGAARASFEQVLKIYRETLPPNHPYLADTMQELAHVLWELGAGESAREMVEGGLAIRRKALPPGHPDLAISLNALGLIQSDLGQHEASRKSLEEALVICRKALPPDHPFIATDLQNLGNLHRSLRKYAEAKAAYEEALAIRRKGLPPGHPDIANGLGALAWTELASGTDPADAVAHAAEATDILRAEQIRLAVAQAEPEQLAMTPSVNLFAGFLVDATLAARGDPGPAYDRVVSVKGSVTAQQRWARQARDATDPETVRLLDQLRRVTRQIVGVSVGERPPSRSSDSEGGMASLRNLSDERARLERRLTDRSAEYRAVQARAAVGSREIRDALPGGTALIDLVDYLHVQSPAQAQEESLNTRLVSFVVRPDREGVAMVPLGPIEPVAELIDRWRASYGAGKAPLGDEPDPGAELRKRLWEPLAKHLDGVKVVLISPDGPLNGLPWAALPGSKQGTLLIHEYAFAVVPVPQLLPELLRAAPLPANEQPSLLLVGGIDFGQGKAPTAGPQAAKRPPVPMFRPLPGTESEVNDLEARFRRTFPRALAPEVLSEDQATKSSVLVAAPSHPFVHLATHGFFADQSEVPAVDVTQRTDLLRSGLRLHAEATGRHPGLLSGLVFAGVNRPDRRPEETILTALEAAELNLEKVELVVLSACETGRGRVAGGEGVLGLQRAFQLAGARSVVASLWKVPDEETHQLMREFYRSVWSKKAVSRAEALRQAQLWMLRNWTARGGVERTGGPQGPPPPYVWAAFVLSGEWR
jgi:CHAT domain-containing protein/tetratricopeptide (TPR) repeat protein